MAQPTNNPARTAVFQTAELLEHILDFVPAKEILVSHQRVCQQFKDLFKSSSKLQQKLLLPTRKATQPIEKWAIIDENAGRKVFVKAAPESADKSYDVGTFNSLLAKLWKHGLPKNFPTDLIPRLLEGRDRSIIHRGGEALFFEEPQYLLRGMRKQPEQSWQEMVLIDIPCPKVTLSGYGIIRGDICFGSVDIRIRSSLPAATKLGELMDNTGKHMCVSVAEDSDYEVRSHRYPDGPDNRIRTMAKDITLREFVEHLEAEWGGERC